MHWAITAYMWGVLTKARALQAHKPPHPSQEEAVKILEWELNDSLAKLKQTLGQIRAKL